jgi:hypothetical protein
LHFEIKNYNQWEILLGMATIIVIISQLKLFAFRSFVVDHFFQKFHSFYSCKLEVMLKEQFIYFFSFLLIYSYVLGAVGKFYIAGVRHFGKDGYDKAAKNW